MKSYSTYPLVSSFKILSLSYIHSSNLISILTLSTLKLHLSHLNTNKITKPIENLKQNKVCFTNHHMVPTSHPYSSLCFLPVATEPVLQTAVGDGDQTNPLLHLRFASNEAISNCRQPIPSQRISSSASVINFSASLSSAETQHPPPTLTPHQQPITRDLLDLPLNPELPPTVIFQYKPRSTPFPPKLTCDCHNSPDPVVFNSCGAARLLLFRRAQPAVSHLLLWLLPLLVTLLLSFPLDTVVSITQSTADQRACPWRGLTCR